MLDQNILLLIELNTKQKEIEAQIKEIKATVIDALPDEWFIANWYKVARIEKKNFKINQPDEVIMSEFPSACKVKIDIDALRNIPDAHKYLNVESSPYIQITKQKDGGN